MHLNRLSIRNFKKYRRIEIEFQDGLTGIVGGNGTGKSTIVEAIAWVLYGSKASTIKREFIKNSRSGENDSVEVVLNLGIGNHELSISRGMRGKNLAPEATLSIDGRRVAVGSKEVDMRLEELLKISFQDFMKTFYARQKDLDNLLREGGSGKREYLLKLLGLEDIRERAIEQIKSDLRTMDDRKNRIFGALTEMDDVEKKSEDLASAISSARAALAGCRKKVSALAEDVIIGRKRLDCLVEKRRSHDLIAERISGIQGSIAEKKKAIGFEERRLRDIEGLKNRLFELDPKLKRLEVVKSSVELLEPRRKIYDKFLQDTIRINTEVAGLQRSLQDEEQKLSMIIKDRTALEKIKPLEAEHQTLQLTFSQLEALRDRHMELQSSLEKDRVLMASVESSISRAQLAIKQLMEAKAKMEDIVPLLDESKRLQDELARLNHQKDLQKERSGLLDRKGALEARLQKLDGEKSIVHKEMATLGDLEARELELIKQDAELDKLRTDLDHLRENLRGDLKVQQSRNEEARRNLSRVKDLGALGNCPTCERPLGDQHLHLVDKYEKAVSYSSILLEDLKAKIQEQTEKINGAITSRSRLKKSFDELNAKKSRRAELQANLRSLEAQSREVSSECEEITCAVVALGQVEYDPERMLWILTRLEQIRPSVEEYNLLALKIKEIPVLESELETLKSQRQSCDQKIMEIECSIEELGFVESDYLERKKRLLELKPYHDEFLLLSQRILEIPQLEAAIAGRKAEISHRVQIAGDFRKSLQDLCFDPKEYEGLIEERRSLSRMEEMAHKIRLELAAEPEIMAKLNDAVSSLNDLQSGLLDKIEQLKALDYSEAQYVAASQALNDLEKSLESLRKEASSNEVNLGILEGELERQNQNAQRKKEYEQELAVIGHKMEVVDATRILINRFMDHILVRIRSEIVRIAGEILEDVSGKYSLLKIDDDFNILVEDGGEYYPISRYSGGEVDMIAISVRVAISEYLMRFSKEGPGYSFLILDEVFGSQDLEHREKMINMLRSLEERFPQIIAISHFSDVQGQFDNTINVIEDEMGNSRVEVI
jgi:exonuclease SbcC